jgi:hypothetical protein
MKTKNASGLLVGIVITVFMIILVGVVILWSSGYFSQNKKTLDKSTAKIDTAIGSMSEFDLDVYDGQSMRGDSLVELIKDLRDNQVVVSIGIRTLSVGSSGTPKYYNYGFSTDITPSPALTANPPTAKNDADYVNPNGTFIGKVVRNKNDEVVLLEFTQQP